MDEKTILFIEAHQKDNVRKLALQSKRYPDIDMPFVLQQIAGRQIAAEKTPSWYQNNRILYPKHLSLEQCSSEKTAKYKASLCKGNSFVDLTGGMGVDFSFMSQNFAKASYVENQEELANLAKHNFDVLSLNNAVVTTSDAETYLKQMQPVDTIFLDPARRDKTGSKTVLIDDCTPNLKEIELLIDKKCKQAIVKLSPMLDISLALKSLHIIDEIHIVSCNNECKELLLVKSGNKIKQSLLYHCINILNNDSVDQYTFEPLKEEETYITYAKQLHTFLYEPNASVMKAGAYKSIANDFDLNKIHPNSHLYTSDTSIENFPGRRFVICNIVPFSKQELKNAFKDIHKANITTRNFPLTVDEIRKKISVKDGGEMYIFATTMADEKKVLIICEKI